MWYEKVIDLHKVVTDKVSHVERMKSDRYFVWQEEDIGGLHGDNGYGERVVKGTTDLFTTEEFDPWVESFSQSLEESGSSWQYEFVERERETGLYHHAWEWEVLV